MLDILNTLAKGGPVMVPLAVCSMLAATVLVERFLALRHADRGGEELIAGIRRAYREGDGAEALVGRVQHGDALRARRRRGGVRFRGRSGAP